MTLIIVLKLFFGTSLHLRVEDTQLKEFCERGGVVKVLLSAAPPFKRRCPPPVDYRQH